jgi:hypothetical protein
MPLNCCCFVYLCLRIYWIGNNNNNNNNNIDETRRQTQTWWSFNCFGQSLPIIAAAMRTYTTRDSILQTLSGNVPLSLHSHSSDGRAIEQIDFPIDKQQRLFIVLLLLQLPKTMQYSTIIIKYYYWIRVK